MTEQNKNIESLSTSELRELLAQTQQQLERVQQERDDWHEVATVDQLTGLRNLTGLKEIITEISKDSGLREKPYLLHMIDLDGLKKVNDSSGHESGDKLLQEFAEVLESAFGSDAYAIRKSGDEFLVLRPAEPEWVEYSGESDEDIAYTGALEDQQTLDELINMRRQAPESIIATFPELETELKGASLGGSVVHLNESFDLSQDLREAIKKADEMMYRRKQERERTGDRTPRGL